MKAVQPVIASNGVPYLHMRTVESHSASGREKGGKTERTGDRYLKQEQYIYHVVGERVK